MNIFDILHTGSLIEIMCIISIGCLMITGAVVAIIVSRRVLNTSEISPSDLLIGIVGATSAELLMLILAVLTIPLGGEILHRCAIISTSLLLGFILVLSIKGKILSEHRDTLVEIVDTSNDKRK